MNFLIYIYALGSLAVIDSVWLFTTSGFYKRALGHLFAPAVNFLPVLIFYPLYAFGVAYLVVAPAIKSGGSLFQVFISGAILGLVAYGAYDLTNQATLKDWPLQVTVIDMLWGSALTAVASVVAVMIFNYFK